MLTNVETGHHPVWSSGSKELYDNPGPGCRLVAVTVMASRGLGFGPAPPVAKVFASNSGMVERTSDVARDGKRLLGLLSARAAATEPVRPELRVLLHWFNELQTRAPEKQR